MTDTPHSERPDGPPSGQGFFDWLRGLRITRGGERWFAGVASGVAARLGVDPIIVRGAFVVLALLGGPGILLYLLGWLLLPGADGRIHVEEIWRGRASAGLVTGAIIVAVLVVIPAFIGLFTPGVTFPALSIWSWDVWGVLGIPVWLTSTFAWLCWIAIIVLAFLWVRRSLLRTGREQRTADPAGSGPASEPDRPAERGAPVNEQAPEWAERAARDAAEWGRRAGENAAQWGRDAGRRAEEWSARYADHHDSRRLGAAHVLITLAFALLAGGAAALWTVRESGGSLAVGTGALATPLVVGCTAALAVLAVSLIIAGVRGRHTGLIGFLASCGVIALLVTVVLPSGTRFIPFGMMHVDGRADVGGAVIAGNVSLDLSDVGERTHADGDLEVWMLAGRATVELPDTEPTIVRVRMLAGRIDESARTGASEGLDGSGQRVMSGPFLWREIRSNVEPGAADEAEVVTLTVLAGNVEVEGGSGSERLERGTPEQSAAELEEQVASLEADLEEAEWRLEEPGLSTVDRRDIEAERDEIRREIDALEREMNR
ncbi:PspC domain-containing protein [Leucobacter sp. USHLN153]|uniref:PspC domain-containing protein n=1 Tax=Leucobacter sp. USHLN153 TaxID=3081268 RepID=UPI003018C720